MSRLIRLYPRAWRARYGDELEDLVAARPLGLGGSIDLVLGALDAHRHPELVDPAADPTSTPVSQQRFDDLRFARRLGRTAWLGAALWITGWVIAANGPIVIDGDGEYRDGSAGFPFVLLAMALLAGGLIGQMIRVPNRARAARVGAFVAIVAGPVWGLGPWNLIIGGAALAGIVLLAIGALWSNQWRWPATLAVTGSALVGAAIIAVAILTWDGDRLASQAPMTLAVAVFTPIWLVVGATLQALPPVDPGDDGIDVIPRPATAA